MITIFTRKDLRRECKKTRDISDVEYHDFTQSKDPFIKADLVIFVDDEKFMVLKNRLLYPQVDTLYPLEHLDSVLVDAVEKLSAL